MTFDLCGVLNPKFGEGVVRCLCYRLWCGLVRALCDRVSRDRSRFRDGLSLRELDALVVVDNHEVSSVRVDSHGTELTAVVDDLSRRAG